MNLWKLAFKDNELEIELVIKARDLDSALEIGSKIAKEREWQLKLVKQLWRDRGLIHNTEEMINAY